MFELYTYSMYRPEYTKCSTIDRWTIDIFWGRRFWSEKSITYELNLELVTLPSYDVYILDVQQGFRREKTDVTSVMSVVVGWNLQVGREGIWVGEQYGAKNLEAQ